MERVQIEREVHDKRPLAYATRGPNNDQKPRFARESRVSHGKTHPKIKRWELDCYCHILIVFLKRARAPLRKIEAVFNR